MSGSLTRTGWFYAIQRVHLALKSPAAQQEATYRELQQKLGDGGLGEPLKVFYKPAVHASTILEMARGAIDHM